MDLPSTLTRAAGEGRLLVVWGALPFPLAESSPAVRSVALDLLPRPPELPGDLQRALPSLPLLPILSLDASSRLENDLAAAGAAPHVVRGRRDVPAAGRHNVFKLAGDLGTRRGVILRRAELRDLQADPDRRHLLDEARRAAAGGALLLVGCDPADGDFQAWWAVLAPSVQGLPAFSVGDPAAPWPEGVVCLGPDLAALTAALPRAGATRPAAAAPGPRTLTWLHLSDMHVRLPGATAGEPTRYGLYDANVVLRALLADVKERIAEDDLRPDLILVSGDVAFSGKADEYALAALFFADLLAATGLLGERLFLVPGNHDVDRGRISRGARGMASSLTDRAAANDVLANPADRELLMARLGGYAAFLGDHLPGHPPFDAGRYFYTRTLDLPACRLAILGLNTAWLAEGGEEDRGRLLLGERQVRAALDEARAARPALCLALMHHPFDWLRDFDRDDSAAMLEDGCDFILQGHMHRVGLLQGRGPDGEAMTIGAGACYESREHPNTYNLVRLDLEAGRGEVHLRAYSDRRGGFWTRDAMNYRSVPDGVYRFSLPGPIPASDPRHPITAPTTPASSVPSTVTPAPASSPATPASSTCAHGYNLAAVREMLLAAFSAEDFRRLFLYTSDPDLRPLRHEFGARDGLAALADTAIDYCLHRRLLPALLAEVEKANPRQYAQFAARLHP